METRKILGEVRKMPEGESRKVVFVASTNTRDRHKTVLNQGGWKLDNFNRNPVIGYQHNVYGDICNPPNPDDVLGPARAWVEDSTRGKGDKDLMVEIDFETADVNPLADKIFKKIKNGSLRAVSVGFMEIGEGRYGEKEEQRGGENETYYFEGQELVEISVVNIPSNPEALKKQLRSNTRDALVYLVKAFGDKYSLSDIDNMKVCEIRELLGHRKAIGPRVIYEGEERYYEGDFDLTEPPEFTQEVDAKDVAAEVEYQEFLDKLDVIEMEVKIDNLKQK